MKTAQLVLGSVLMAAVLFAAAFAQQGQAPVPPDPTAQNPTSPAPPQSTPPTFPETQKEEMPPPQSEKAPAPVQNASPSETPEQRGPGNPIVGRISETNGQMMLRAEGVDYKLDDQDKAKQFNGKNVAVAGHLDKGTNTVHIQSIREVKPQR